MMYFRVSITIFSCLVMFCAMPAAAVTDGIVAIVNNEVITHHDLNEVADNFLTQVPSNLKPEDREKLVQDTRTRVLNQLIDNMLVTQEAKRTGITIKEEEITGSVEDMLKRRSMTLQQLKSALVKEGSSYEIYRKELKEYLMKQRLAAKEVRSRISVSDDEIGEYYGTHRQEYEGEEAVKIQQMLIHFPQKKDDQVINTLRERAEGIVKELKSGGTFEKVASEHASDVESQGGADLGFIQKGTMLREVDEVAFRLKVGEYSGVIESSVGFHIIKVIDRRGAGLKSLGSVRDEIREELEKQKLDRKIQEWIQDLRSKSYIEIKKGL